MSPLTLTYRPAAGNVGWQWRRNFTVMIFLLCLAAIPPAAAQRLRVGVSAGMHPCPMVKMQLERLPNLNVPRMGHSVFCVGGEVVAAGGHTTGFVPTPTAEYYHDGAWHLMQMAYPHDHGVTAVMSTGEVLLAGGHQEALGIGQTFTLELYDPATHSFKGYGSLGQKRCFANTLPMDSGRIVISGNWYHDDCIEVYDGSRQCKFVKPVAQHRSLPHIIRTAKDNAIIFGSHDIHADDFDTIIVDRLKGEPFTVPLFETWRPICPLSGYHGSCFIGDETKGDYTSLIQVLRGDSLMAIARVMGEDFSLLPTTCPIPMQSQWSPICWYAPVIADRSRGRAYIVGYGENYPEDAGDHRFYVAAIDYLSDPSPVTLYYSEPQDSAGRWYPVLTDSGDLMVVGGILQQNNNYEAASTVFLLHVSMEEALASTESRQSLWLWPVFASLLLAAIMATCILLRRRRKSTSTEETAQTIDNDATVADKVLMERICRYMEDQQPYLNSELKVQDVADALGTNRTYVSNCIRSQRGSSFSQFVNAYRVEYAQQLLHQHPDKKISEVSISSGFSTESSFFRAFKAVAGTTPKAMVEQEQNDACIDSVESEQ